MQNKSFSNNEQEHNIRESKRILRDAKKGKKALSSSQQGFVKRTRMTSTVDAIFAAYK